MRKLILLASVAAMAVTMPVLAKEKGQGGKGGGNPHAAQSHSPGHGNGRGGGKPDKARRGGDHAVHAQRAERAPKHAKFERQAVVAAPRGRGHQKVKAERQARQSVARFEDRRGRNETRVRDDRRFDDPRRLDNRGFDDRRFNDGRRLAAFGQGCPPGLAKKNNGCLPPGQAKKIFARGDRFQSDWYSGYAIPASYRSFYQNTPDTYYRYDDIGRIYRVDSGSNMVTGLIPLLGGGFAVGQPLPAGYDVYNLPYQYRDNWYDTDDAHYRYGDNAIYQVDPQSGMIESIVALLGGDLNVGQALPAGYDAYNVPLDYRDQYTDTDEDMYRYADGNIYQVDTKTQIIQAIVEMLA